MPSFHRGLSTLSLGSHKKTKKRSDDDGSVTTFATESPLKYKEASKNRLSKVQVPLLPRAFQQTRCDARAVEEHIVDSRDVASVEDYPEEKEESTAMRRSSSFQSLKNKMENLTTKVFHRRHHFDRTNSLLHDHDPLTTGRSDKPDPHGDKNSDRSIQNSKQLLQTVSRVVEPKSFLHTLGNQLSLNSDQQDELLASFLEETAGCGATEAQLQSRLLMDSMALQLNKMTQKTKSLQSTPDGVTNSRSLSDDAAGFLDVLSDELKVTETKLPRGQDDLVLFLGDELEASTCGRPQITDGLGRLLYKYDFDDDDDDGNANRRRRMVPIKEGGAVEEMLESIEMGYEASLIGCGLAQ